MTGSPQTDPCTCTRPHREVDRTCPEHGLTEPPHATKWTVHVVGPDGLHYYDTEAEAEEAAQSVNEWWARQPKNEFTPSLRAVVIPPFSEGEPDDR